ncbi:MAG: hypothetical protein K8823_523 [Cenarchaeum symbiont of Oopsacas minuta]|nr:hypothetical protein [Cenarchaeum symbiont of Oopsacas minuta]
MKCIVVMFMFMLMFGAVQYAAAQDVGGGVDKDGEWHVGEGLKIGDRFKYTMCHVEYKDCKVLTMDFWFKDEITINSENKWLVEAVVYDGRDIIKGQIHLGKIAPEPTGGSEELRLYRSAFKSSIVWLSSFATSYEGTGDAGPKKFKDISWGKIANIGGQQVKPTSIEDVNTRAGVFEDAVLVTWRTGGLTSQIWVIDEFPFPVKASTWTHVSEGIAPQEYKFELLDYQEGVTVDPYVDILSTATNDENLNCPKNSDYVKVKKTSSLSSYIIDLKYRPSEIKLGCEIDWIINFRSPYDESDFLYQVHYDILVIKPSKDGGDNTAVKSLAYDEDRLFMFSQSGQVQASMDVMHSFNPTQYDIIVYGLGPIDEKPSGLIESLTVKVPFDGPTETLPVSNTTIPSWIKTSASFWVQGDTSDAEFVSAIQYLVENDVIVLPPTEQGSNSSNDVPSWIKTTTGLWIDGITTDDEFINAIQYLVKQGIIIVS